MRSVEATGGWQDGSRPQVWRRRTSTSAACVSERSITLRFRHTWSATVVVSAASRRVISPVFVLSKNPISCRRSDPKSRLRMRTLSRAIATVNSPPARTHVCGHFTGRLECQMLPAAQGRKHAHVGTDPSPRTPVNTAHRAAAATSISTSVRNLSASGSMDAKSMALMQRSECLTAQLSHRVCVLHMFACHQQQL